MIILQRLLIIIIVLGGWAIGANSTIAGQSDLIPPKNQCSTNAYVIDPVKQGLNIRRQPTLSGQIMGRLPKNTEVNILGIQDQWALISVINPRSQRVAFRGEGWVHSSLLGVSSSGYRLKSVSLYNRPSLRSGVAAQISPNKSTKILECNGKWLRVETKNRLKRG